MPRRWIAALAAVTALVALACEGSGGGGRPTRPPDSPRPGLPASMAALGDSVTTAFGSCLVLASCQRNSWSTGDGSRVDSHYRRLVELNPKIRGHARNLAVPGARAAALADQARAAVAHRPDYVTLLVGANDACRARIDAMTPVADFRAAVDRALGVLRKGRPRARLLVVSIPDLNRLWEIGHTDPRIVRVWNHGLCPALLAAPTSGAEADVRRRAVFRDRIDAYNRQLAAACRAYGPRCRWDGGAVHRIRFTRDMVNPLDYFHPSVTGQNKLAQVSWAAAGFTD